MRKIQFISLLALLCAASACKRNLAPDAEQSPVLSYAPSATKAGLASIFEDFKVWTSIEKGSDILEMMAGYRANYDAESTAWSYVSGDGVEGQTIHRWDEGAAAHRFLAGAPSSRVSAMSNSSLTLSLANATSLSGTSLFCVPCIVGRNDPEYGNVVNLQFCYANARVNLAFKVSSAAQVQITDIRLTPSSAYATMAELQLNYDWTRRKVTVLTPVAQEQSSEPLTFPDVIVPASNEGYVETSVPVYMIPDPASKGQWTVSMLFDGVYKEVAFTVSKAWQSGKSYTYRFEYNDEANLIFQGTQSEIFIGEDPVEWEGGEHNFG